MIYIYTRKMYYYYIRTSYNNVSTQKIHSHIFNRSRCCCCYGRWYFIFVVGISSLTMTQLHATMCLYFIKHINFCVYYISSNAHYTICICFLFKSIFPICIDHFVANTSTNYDTLSIESTLCAFFLYFYTGQ